MKIGPNQTMPAVTPAVAERQAPSQASQPARAVGNAAEPSATVQLSSAAVAASQGGDGSFDAQKVDRISKAIADGSFKVNPEAIADKLIANAQELLGRTSP